MSEVELPVLPLSVLPGAGKNELDSILWTAARLGASDVSIQSEDFVYFMLMGIQTRSTVRTLQQFEVETIATLLYGSNATAMLSQGSPIDMRYEIRPVRGERIGFRINMLPARLDGNDAGIAITFRVLPKNPPHINDLKVPREIVENALPRNGLVVVAGVTSSGKSTLIASILRMAIENKDDPRKIATYEAPIEYIYDGIPSAAPKISQTQIGGNAGRLEKLARGHRDRDAARAIHRPDRRMPRRADHRRLHFDGADRALHADDGACQQGRRRVPPDGGDGSQGRRRQRVCGRTAFGIS